MRSIFCLTVLLLSPFSSATRLFPPKPFFIKSPYKVDRFGHFTASAAARNPQKLAGAILSSEKEIESQTSTVDETTKNRGLAIYTYQNFSPVTLEAAFESLKTSDDATSSPVDERINEFTLGLGAVIPSTPVAVGLNYIGSKTKDNTPTGDDDWSNDVWPSVNVEVSKGVFVGAALDHSESSDLTDEDTVYVGAGMEQSDISGEVVAGYQEEKDDKNTTFIAQGALDQGANQIVGVLFSYSSKDKVDDEDLLYALISGGYYFDLGGFYVQPELGIASLTLKQAGSTLSDSGTLFIGFEGGYRTEKLNLFLHVGRTSEDEDIQTTSETRATGFEAGAQLYF